MISKFHVILITSDALSLTPAHCCNIKVQLLGRSWMIQTCWVSVAIAGVVGIQERSVRSAAIKQLQKMQSISMKAGNRCVSHGISFFVCDNKPTAREHDR